MFSDDTVIFFDSDDWEEMLHLTNTCINRVKQWMDSILIISKTKHLTFSATIPGPPQAPQQFQLHN